MSKFQVVLPCLNGARTLPWTLRTMTELQDDDVTFLLSNNCSTDRSEDIMREFAEKDPRFQVVRTDKILPLQDSLEFAFSHATGDFIMLTGGDDGLYQGCLSVAREALRQHPQAMAIAHRSSFLLWPEVSPEACDPGFPPGGLRIGAANTFELRCAKDDLRQQALGMIHSPMPAPYQGWVSKELVSHIRQRIGRVFAHYVTDYWFAAATGAELHDAHYVRTGLPLNIAAYSVDSSALTFFNNSDSRVGDSKLQMESTTGGNDLMFLTKSARGYRYEILKLVLEHWDDAPFTRRELDLNYLCGFWEEWKQRTIQGDVTQHSTAGSAQVLRSWVERTAAAAGLSDLIADLDAQYVFKGDNSSLWRKWGTSFQQDSDWAHDLCIDTRRLGCQNVYDVSKALSVIIEAVMQAGDAFAKILSGKRMAGGPADSPPPDLGLSGFAAVRRVHEELLQKATRSLEKDTVNLGKKQRKLNEWKVNDSAPWALRTGLKVARFLGKATGTLPK